MNPETYFYAKERRRFGRTVNFQHATIVVAENNIMPDPELRKNWIAKNPVDCSTQLSRQMATNATNTVNKEYVSRGTSHLEGGWPKDVNATDEEQTIRYRKKIERDERYASQMKGLVKVMEKAVKQNNAVNIHENYFEGADFENEIAPKDLTARMAHCFRNPGSNKSGATCISFSPEDDGNNMAIAYANNYYQAEQAVEPNSYIWCLEDPLKPIQSLQCESPCLTLEYNPQDAQNIAGGLMNGKVCVWDCRSGGAPQLRIIQQELAHRDRVMSLKWVHSKTGSEFYSGSADGQLYWWDTRFFTKPIEQLLCDPLTKLDEPQERHRAHGCTILEYEYTIPTRFLVGTDAGTVLFGNRKGQQAAEKISYFIKCNNGSIRSLERNPVFLKNFLTIGDASIKIWSEDCRENPIIWTKNNFFQLRCGTWSRKRCSLLFCGRNDGVLDFWDLLLDQKEPVVSLKASTSPINHIRPHENGKWLACVDGAGDTFLLELSEYLRNSNRNDRSLMSAIFEREIRREKILEAKLRELKLNERKTDDHPEQLLNDIELGSSSHGSDEVEKDFTQQVMDEKKLRFGRDCNKSVKK